MQGAQGAVLILTSGKRAALLGQASDLWEIHGVTLISVPELQKYSFQCECFQELCACVT